jgi:putative transposase
MGVTAVYRRPRTSLPGKGEECRVYPYLLGATVSGPDEAWCAEITSLPIGKGFAYLVAVMDWHTRAVLPWKLSNTLDTAFRLDAFRDAVRSAGRTRRSSTPTKAACSPRGRGANASKGKACA